ncbi:mechanosensitive ion channel family protein [Paracholeplasma manati]|uniref:Mechanosensitive ion channel family protein n=1 Tax=Paracholeplasma manati TaxID=591373 RepID=A0ABT2Y539_9MOLU|nr:mechanosensitive ion channel family protein [Paracholeplasma manati]MCV2231865.1 mechanosensitive ion channel family protein [Paracholeplasma manati]MDG0889112.1 mechanosensitive ion channel family protein [Paracholeplasma manati]
MLLPFLSQSAWVNAGFTIGILAILIVFFIFENKLIKKYEERLSKFTIIVIYIASFLLMTGGLLFILWLWSFDYSTLIQDIQDGTLAYIEASLGRMIASILVFFLSMMIVKIAKIALKKVGVKATPLQKRKKTIAKVTLSIIRYTVGILSILIILAIWGVNVVPALAGLGIMGLVIGLGAQKFINDLIAGFFIIFEQHFDVGDTVEVKGFKGQVSDIGLKTTRIKNWKGDVMILANGEITNMINYSRNPSIAIVDFGIAYEENVQAVIELLNKELIVLKTLFPQVVEDPTVVGVTNLDASQVTLRAIVKTENEQHYAVERGMRKLIKEILNANNIEIPFPQIVVSNKE